MDDFEEDFQFIHYNFPPASPTINNIDGKVTCDLTSYDPSPDFPVNIYCHPQLQVFKIFTNYITIPHELGRMENLEHLVLCRCENENEESPPLSIPKSLGNLSQLKVLDLRNNNLGTFPAHLTRLINLQELCISNCQLTGLPELFAYLQNLEILDISNNLLEHLPSCITRLSNLRKLYVSDGNLQDIPEDIKNLKKLERLQLTKNKLSTLPDGLFKLINLKKLHLNSNLLMALHENLGNLVNLRYLVLNQNKLKTLPRSIGQLKELRYLNLHENLLSSLPRSIKHLGQMETLLCDNNPLQVPPVGVCNQGIQSIRSYYHAMDKTKDIHSKRLKVLILGQSMAGKTCLVKMLMEGESTQINEDDRTFGVVFYNWKPEPHVDELELMVIDCAGQKAYQMTHQLFLSEGALFILVVNLSRYVFENSANYHEEVAQWISLVASRVPKAKILLVPTHVDQCNEEEIDLKCRNIVKNMKEQREEMLREIIENVKLKLEHCVSSDEKSKIMEQLQEQKDKLPVLSLHYKEEHENLDGNLAMNVIAISNQSLAGTLRLRRELVRIARDKNLSPYVDITLPESWVNVEKEIKALRKSLKVPCLSISKLHESLIIRKIEVTECELRSCVSYLDTIGELQYFKDIQGMQKNIVLNPYWLGSLLKNIFRHDFSLEYNESIRMIGIVKFMFDQDKNELLENAVMSEKILRCLWLEFFDDEDIFSELVKLLTYFGFACKIPTPAYHLTDAPEDGPSGACYLLPWFFKTERRGSFHKIWPPKPKSSQIEVTAGFGLSRYLPFGIFQRFSVLCHRHEPDDYDHWQNGFHMNFDDVHIHSNVMRDHRCETLQVTARAPKLQVEKLWKVLLTLLEELQKLLKEWPGMQFVTFTTCPQCVKLGVTSPHRFPGDWFRVSQNRRNNVSCPAKIDGVPHKVNMDHLFPSKVAFQEYLHPESTEIPDVCLRHDWLDDIAIELGTSWPALARKLQLGKLVETIKVDIPGKTREQSAKMLTKWMERMGRDAKIEIIIKALRELDLNNVADVILTKSRQV